LAERDANIAPQRVAATHNTLYSRGSYIFRAMDTVDFFGNLETIACQFINRDKEIAAHEIIFTSQEEEAAPQSGSKRPRPD